MFLGSSIEFIFLLFSFLQTLRSQKNNRVQRTAEE